ncbi:d5-like helicase-primase: PROVISIONAL [Gigaspora margarita]|uniref:D5-like helicase-primase: PROVISIONAL n=1 Tax=Gigaspora margarita TaxID=4874 RepID=A0A8H4EIP1_GIGMA|nr:d5-like helicase-primase: PROVISIONAL [Gigaspora margarita]
MSKQNAQLKQYRSRKTDDYSSDSDNFSDNTSECELKNCSDYGSDCESDNETNTIETLVAQPSKVEKQISNTIYSIKQVSSIYSKKQERFDDKFTQKDVINKISNEEISLLDVYTQEELADKLVIQVEQSDYKKFSVKFSVVNDISKVYEIFGIYEYINGQNLLRPVIDIDAFKEKIETKNVNTKNVFFSICCLFVRALYRILNCSWKEIIKELVIMISSDDSKCSYHLLYTPTLLVNY